MGLAVPHDTFAVVGFKVTPVPLGIVTSWFESPLKGTAVELSIQDGSG